MIRMPGFWGMMCSAVLPAAAWSTASGAALAQSAVASSATPDKAAEIESHEQVWTCQMHAQIRQSEPGKCSICGMKLTVVGDEPADGSPRLLGLQQMLAIALEHNASVRAAQAHVQAAEAELDRTRFEVLQQIMGFREKWQSQRRAMEAAFEEFRLAEEVAENDNATSRQLAEQAKEEYFRRRTRLAELEAELPFLLGHDSKTAIPEPNAASRKLLRDELLPKARQLIELRTRQYATGNASILDVLAAHRQATEFETLLATTNQQRIAAVESQKELLQNTFAIAKRLYDAGQLTQDDVLAVDVELSKLDLRLLELKGE